ncbi:MAG: translation initiation factor eIF-2B [Deltaproteobacteria bacterium]|nr:MAG: translation initiation factor eIF-2B [Deltaproteobacteria bacterium]
MKVEGIIEQIRKDNVSGAAEISRKAAKALILWSRQRKGDSHRQSMKELLALGVSLVKAQPSMAPIFNLVNRILLEVEGLEEGEQIRKKVEGLAGKCLEEMDRRAAQIAARTNSIINSPSIIMTYSYSSSVLESLIYARKAGKRFGVICGESRPLFEGRNLVRRLGREGIKSRLVIDAGLSSFLKDADLVLIGADSLTREGVVNKIGSHGLAVLARAQGVPFFTICGIDKFVPRQFSRRQEIELKNPREVLKRPIKNVAAINYYFDITPLSLLSGVICEDGVLARREILRRLSKVKVSSRLIDSLSLAPPRYR